MNIQVVEIYMLYILGLVNYIFVALATYKVAKVENVNNPWLAWIPIANLYLLIKIADGKMYFMVLAIASFFGNALSRFGIGIVSIIGTLLNLAWLIYSIILYNRLCNKYDVNIALFIAGVIAPLFKLVQPLAGMYVPLVAVSLYGHWKIYINASKGPSTKLNIESKVIFSSKKKK